MTMTAEAQARAEGAAAAQQGTPQSACPFNAETEQDLQAAWVAGYTAASQTEEDTKERLRAAAANLPSSLPAEIRERLQAAVAELTEDAPAAS